MKKSLAYAALTALLLGVVTLQSSSAHDHWGQKAFVCGKMSKDEMIRKMAAHESRFLKKFNLTSEQQAKIKEARSKHTEKLYSLTQEVRAAHRELMDSIGKDAEREELSAKFKNLQSKKQSLFAEKLEGMLDIRDILTPEQRQQAITEIKGKKDDLCDSV